MKVLITGATSGIGKAITLHLANLGCKIIFPARNSEKAKALIAQLSTINDTVHDWRMCDVTEEITLKAFNDYVQKNHGTPDVIINNAGIYDFGKVLESSEEQLERMLDQNFRHAYRISQYWMPYLKGVNKGTIIFIGSQVTRELGTRAATYTMAKGILEFYAKLVADEMRDANVGVTRIVLGSVNTPSWGDSDVPISKFAQSEDIALAVEQIIRMKPATWVEEIIIRPKDRNW
jgi:short-subunit dehydrogenase